MKKLKKISRNELKEINGGIRDPNELQYIQCYKIGYCYSVPGDVLGSTGISVNHYGYDVPSGATNVRACGFSAISPAPAGCFS